jgi:hypothetical protein
MQRKYRLFRISQDTAKNTQGVCLQTGLNDVLRRTRHCLGSDDRTENTVHQWGSNLSSVFLSAEFSVDLSYQIA